MRIWPGEAYPLGAVFDGNGTNFSIFSEVAERVELCLYDEQGNESKVDLPEITAYCWHGYLPDIKPGQRYGYRIHGPWEPEKGHRCNPAKLLIDPYARAIEGCVNWDNAVFPYKQGQDKPIRDDSDSAPFVPKSVVVNPYFDWGGCVKPDVPLHETIIYELHTKGFTVKHPDIPDELKGTYAGLGHPASIEYLKNLGITSVELMPVHQFVHNHYLTERGLRNYWGYNSIGYFAPHSEYCSSGQTGHQVGEFKQMVKNLHEAGLEVILDVVYNHTAEGNHLGPMFSFKGIDNNSYYRLKSDQPNYYMDYTGTGNSLNLRHPNVLQLVMDSLRYWAIEMQVDGFRFDLAATLARELHDVERLSSFFDVIHQDPVLSQTKLIAEPWDIGEGGYQVGKFPPKWSEWNGKYRDSMRDYWRSQPGLVGELAKRFSGSSDLYENTGRRPYASVNFITAHDGFTLHDLVSYNNKHNEANGEDNKDGTDDNRSWNCGVEGETDDENINKLRIKQKRNFLVTLLLSQGIPMITGGDETGRTQKGNNNAYCQDNELSWFDWENTDDNLREFTRAVIELRKEHPVFYRRDWFQGREIWKIGVKDIGWYRTDGEEMTEDDWGNPENKFLGVYLCGQLDCLDAKGEPLSDNDFFIAFNSGGQSVEFVIPGRDGKGKWEKVLTTEGEYDTKEPSRFESNSKVSMAEHSMVVLKNVK